MRLCLATVVIPMRDSITSVVGTGGSRRLMTSYNDMWTMTMPCWSVVQEQFLVTSSPSNSRITGSGPGTRYNATIVCSVLLDN